MEIGFILPCFEFRNSRKNMEGEGEEPMGELLHILDALRAITKKSSVENGDDFVVYSY
jgi:hypothetical protein